MDDGFPITPSPPAVTGVDQVVEAFWGICAERHTAGNSLELGRLPLGTPLPIPPGIIPGTKDRLRCRPLWNLLELDDSPPGSTSPHLPGITPGPQDSTFFMPSSGSHIYTTRYTVCVCVSLKTILHPPLLCFSISENNSYRLALC